MTQRFAWALGLALLVTAHAGAEPAPTQAASTALETGRIAVARRPSPFGLMFPTNHNRSLVVTDLQGRSWREFNAPCGDMYVHKMHASPRGPYVVFTCAESQGQDNWVEKSIVLIDLHRNGPQPKVLVRGLHTLLGWSPDGQRIYYWDNAIAQRGHIISRDPFANIEDQHFCCATVALPGPGRSVIGIEHGETDSLIELKANETSRTIVERTGYISEIDASADAEHLYIGTRPDERSNASYLLEEIDVASGSAREIMKHDGWYWLHRVARGWALVNHVVGCRDKLGATEHSTTVKNCDEGWMILSPYAISLSGGPPRMLEPTPSVAGFWLTPDGAMIFAREWGDKDVRDAYFLRPDGVRLGAAPNDKDYGDPSWVRIAP